jgi:hypothetical protein
MGGLLADFPRRRPAIAFHYGCKPETILDVKATAMKHSLAQLFGAPSF